MIHSHQELDAGPDDIIEVMLDGPANVLLLDSTNYEGYRRGGITGIAADWPGRRPSGWCRPVTITGMWSSISADTPGGFAPR